jgi:hypothetical protein
LADLLATHPGVGVSRPKEPDFFTRYYDRGLDWYRSCFPPTDHAVMLDCSTSYSAAPLKTDRPMSDVDNPLVGVPERILALAPDARFIYVIREPVARTYSSYWHSVRAGHEGRSFRDAVNEDSGYLCASDYLAQIQMYLNHVPRDRFLILLFEDLVHNPLEVMNACFELMGLEKRHSPPELPAKNRSFVYRPLLQVLNRRLRGFGGITPVIKMLRPLVPSGLKGFLQWAIAAKTPPVSREDMAFLEQYFLEKNARLEAFLGRSLEAWKLQGQRK